jgi:hypothetical protein
MRAERTGTDAYSQARAPPMRAERTGTDLRNVQVGETLRNLGITAQCRGLYEEVRVPYRPYRP